MTRTPDTRPDQEVAELLNRAEEDDEYTMVDHPPSVLPPRPEVKPRENPLDQTVFYQSMDEEGRIVNVDNIKNIIFFGVNVLYYFASIYCYNILLIVSKYTFTSKGLRAFNKT